MIVEMKEDIVSEVKDNLRETVLDVDRLAGVIRHIDGHHSMGAGALADAIADSGYLAEIWDAAQAVSLPDRETLTKILDDNSIELHAEEYGTGMFFSMEPAEIADAVLAALSTQPTAGEVEWEYLCRGDGFNRYVYTEAEAKKWGDRGYSISKRTKAVEAGPWIEVQ